MQLDDWAAYHETVLYARELAALFPSSQSGLTSEESMSKSSSSPQQPSLLPSPVFVKKVGVPLLTQWMMAAAAAAATCHCIRASDDAEDVDHTTSVVAARWTGMLGMWITLRAELLRNASGGVLTLEEENEVEHYRRYFVPLAWPMLDRGIRELLASHLCALAGKRGLNPSMGDASCATDAASSSSSGTHLRKDEEYEQECDEVCTRAMEATQRVAREQLRISWDALQPNTIPSTVDAKLKRLFEQQSQANKYEADSLPRPSVVHTNCLGGLLQALTRFRLQTQRQHADNGRVPWLTLTQNALLHIGYDLLTKVRSAVIERCYYLIPALLDYESCLLLYEEMLQESAALQLHRKELTRNNGILRLTLQSLLQSAFSMYERVIEALLADYKKNACRPSARAAPRFVHVPVPMSSTNPLVAHKTAKTHHMSDAVIQLEPPTPPCAGDGRTPSAVMRLSESAFSILVEVLEPTCDLLQRYPTDENALPTRLPRGTDGCDQGASLGGHTAREGGRISSPSGRPPLGNEQSQYSMTIDVRREVVPFLRAMMSNCFATAAEGSGAVAKKAQQQAAADAYLTATYLSTYGPHCV